MAEMRDIFQKLIATFDKSDFSYVIVGGFAAKKVSEKGLADTLTRLLNVANNI
ncbi:hypothetical protein NEF87_000565 [Candidatus Lokiarchaeum ossiferum]|uniref:50S ribosomal protein L10 n=1 Tax=Candidatus Lokiarchaeum ossiferum TaxID=2951803 RepID=A0ABY6HL96_9ARCH|nr:hypothetical protein NEF87_000565 [Candidatus Lokiarchaeum sp. B-35]